MGIRRSWSWLAAAAVALTVTVLVMPTGAHATSPAPSVRLVTGIRHIDVQRFGKRARLFLPEVVYVGATHGNFRIDADRTSGHIQLRQVRSTGHGLQTIRLIHAPGPVRMPTGLPGFLTTTLRNAAGNVVASTRTGFCPTATYDAQRIDPHSPPTPTYPGFCGSELTHAMVWGINRGWAVPVYPNLKAAPDVAPDGTYRLTVSITPTYAHQLHVSRADASRSITLRLTTESNGGCGDGFCPAARRAARAAQPATAPVAVPRPSYGGSTGPVSSGLPDLAALPARDLTIRHSGNGNDYLGFAATIWNAGPGTFDVEGFRIGSRKTMVARQYVGRHGRLAHPTKIGSFEFDTRPGHDHWHLRDVARYDLLDLKGNRVVLSHKQSFCLAPTDPINLTRPGAVWNPDSIGLSSNCPTAQSLWLRESLPAGWGDTYVQSAGGQAFNITGVPNGRYLIRVTANPRGRVHEITRHNDSAYLAIDLGGTPGDRTATAIGPVAKP
ncbi:MAG TPA: lysyl oxidase family protein [Mycobacteriales bacterium]|nr:lysyl oxidase family protein [Mycobacteriales bacterium]